jgi:hypothetical protein
MADNFDLKKFLFENKALENLNPIIGKENINEGDLRSKIREIVLAELGSEDYELEDRKQKYGINPEMEDEDYSDYFFDIDTPEEDLDEAKKKKDEDTEDIDTTEIEAEETSTEDVPTEDVPAAGGNLEDIAANMEGTESEVMDHLMSALKIAKGMNNEKLTTQIGNTLKFFVSEYIGGGE